jgi:hypothetical protein
MNIIDQFVDKQRDSIFGEITHMHPDDLKTMWICRECHKVFVFHSDVDDHKGLSGHKKVEKVTLISPETFA